MPRDGGGGMVGVIVLAVIAWTILILMAILLKKNKRAKNTDSNNTNNKQLDNVLKNKYEKQKLFNKREEEVFKLVLNLINQHAKGHYRINGQTSLGEILTCKDRNAYFAINAKRVDMLIVNREMEPVAVIEVNGTGHYQNNALERDEIKRAAIESAGIKYIAIRENENIKEKLDRELIYILNSSLSF